MFMLFLAAVFFAGEAGNAYAQQPVTFEATVDRNVIELGSFVQLNLTVTGTQSVNPITLPEIDGFQSKYIGPSTSVTIINGQHSVSKSFTYYLYPMKIGTFTIPSLMITLDNKDYSSEAIPLQVVSNSTKLPLSQEEADRSESLQDKIFVMMVLPKKEFYLHERVPLSIKLFMSDISVKDVQYPIFEHVGFTIAPYEEPSRYEQTISGVRYQVIEFRTTLYPTRTGELSLGPARETVSLLFRETTRRRSGMGSFFDDSFFNSILDRYDTRSVTLESSVQKINVLPLPSEGQPQDFSGAVGQFGFDMTVSPTDIKVGDPITVRMRITGEGDLKAVQFPAIKDPEEYFKLYDPQITEEAGGIKVLEQVVIPKDARVQEIPKVVFSYFDVASRSYQKIEKGPFPLQVSSVDEGQGLKVVGPGAAQIPAAGFEQEKVGRDIVFIKEFPGAISKRGANSIHGGLLFFYIVLFACLWVGIYAAYHFAHRMKTDKMFARKFMAPKFARQGLAQAGAYLKQGKQKEFYDALFKTLQGYFADKFRLQAGNVTVDAILSIIQEKGMKTFIGHEVRSLFDECEMVRYAAVAVGREKMEKSFSRTQKIIDFFERKW